MTFTPIAARLAVELSLPDFTTYVCLRLGFEHQTFRLRGERSNAQTYCATTAVKRL